MFFMQLLKFLPITPGTTRGSGGAVSGKSPQTRACIVHIEMKTYLHNLLLDRVGRKWGTSASRVLSEWEVREVPVLVLVLGESADYWRLATAGDGAHGRRSSDRTWARSKLMVRICLPNRENCQIEKLKLRLKLKLKLKLRSLSYARVYYINMNNDFLICLRDKARRDAAAQIIWSSLRASMGKS